MNIMSPPRKAAFEWIVYHFTGAFGATALTLIIFGARESLQPGLGAITDGGQFAAYSLAMGSTTYYLISRSSAARLRLSSLIGLANLPVIIGSLALSLVAILHSAGDAIDLRYLEYPSVALLLYAAVVAFFAVSMDNERPREVSSVTDLTDPKSSDIDTLKLNLMRRLKAGE